VKFEDLSGREHFIDIRPSRWPRKNIGEGRGKFQTEVGNIIDEIYPDEIILEEFPCLGTGLYLDFFLPRRRLAVEVQGRQHRQFVAFFHKTKADFKAQQKRDILKEDWCKLNEITLIKIDTGTDEDKIRKAFA